MVSDYDARLAQEINEVSKEVDVFYGGLIETKESDRMYSKYKDKYIQIEVDIRSLLVQNKKRPLNSESSNVIEKTLNKWLKYKKAHSDTNAYKTGLAKIHRTRFTRHFSAMTAAEEAKKLTQKTN
ncbi:hypothetical protein BOW53_16245 [Solemya pervernicosa gill symbiont]|uniref:Uncharacterized protein n=2 Tax=Solemya pervernicosa gill symbiont TaxID=642797 RepID=A0A1T2KZE2_9GAMM|nr:hypothetical protein BOW53_16245 [Solemya pervernicosa gill symbiont]